MEGQKLSIVNFQFFSLPTLIIWHNNIINLNKGTAVLTKKVHNYAEVKGCNTGAYWDCVGVRACAYACAHATRGARQMGRASMYGTWYAYYCTTYICMHAFVVWVHNACLLVWRYELILIHAWPLEDAELAGRSYTDFADWLLNSPSCLVVIIYHVAVHDCASVFLCRDPPQLPGR